MIILPNLIANEIFKFSDPEHPNFIGSPEDINEAAELWALVFNETCKEVQPPSANLETATVLFEETFKTMTYELQNGTLIFQQAAMAFATELALGMTPSGFTGVPPPIPLPLNPTGFITKDREIEINNLSDIIYNWLKTGTAINIISGVTINWQ